jgi:predicted O-linked N-acetylglucosamine transferase (SPINDLY family)
MTVLDAAHAIKKGGTDGRDTVASAVYDTVASGDNGSWLDGLIASVEHSCRIASEAEEIGRRLGATGFEELVGAIERARPALSAGAEIRLYQDWIGANPHRSPLLFAAWFNTGVALARAGDRAGAVVAYGNALALNPNFHAAAVNLGLSLEAMGQPDDALRAWAAALQPEEARVALLTQRARLLERLGRLDEAESILRALLAIDPAQPDVVHHWVHIRQKICQWPAVPVDMPGLPPEALLRQSGPLGILALTDDIDAQRETAANWIARKTQPAPRQLSPIGGYRHDRVRIGYLSSDFCRHAMSYLITELFERHDRTRFEIFGYCSSAEDGSDLRRRVITAFDHHRFIRDLSDEAAAALIARDEIDILIDLNGITDGTRLQILRWRPAPVQATYLGFIGSVPLPELDFLLCDRFVIPPDRAPSYRPRPLPIGPLYQANDTKRVIGPPLSREEAGLPSGRFILCCFSNHYKITAEIFAAWLSILRQAPNAILWLSTDNQWSRRNLLDAAARAGVAADRIVFAPRTEPETYMRRLALADLFLDTFPYNAGTIASDAIRMGLPLLTLCGRAFASRMAGSLLTATGAQDGIAHTLADYVARATLFASDADAYARFRALFSAEAWRRGIGDIHGFTARYEETLLGLVAGRAKAEDDQATARMALPALAAV